MPNHLKFENTGEQVPFLGVSPPLLQPLLNPKKERTLEKNWKRVPCQMPVSPIVFHAKVSAVNWSYVYDIRVPSRKCHVPKKGARCQQIGKVVKVGVKIANVKFSLCT